MNGIGTVLRIRIHLSLWFLLSACRVGDGSSRTLEEYGYDPKYRQLTSALLAEEPDTSLEWAILQHVAWTINQDYDREREIVSKLSPGLQMVYATHGVEAEVNNGGFNQYFYNTSGGLADIALKGFRELGASEHEQLMREALAVYDRVRPRLEAARKAGTLAAFSETYADSAFAVLDQRFYALDADLSRLRIGYIRSNPGQFTGP